MEGNRQDQGKQNQGGQNMSGGSDRMDTAGDATRGEGSGNMGGGNRESQGGSSTQGQNAGNRQGTDMQNDRRPSGSTDEGQKGFEDRDREKKPA